MNSDSERKKILLISYDKDLTILITGIIGQFHHFSISETITFPPAFNGQRLGTDNPDLVFILFPFIEDDSMFILEEVCRSFGHLRIILVLKKADHKYVEKALDFGVHGVIIEASLKDVFLHALSIVERGGIFLDEEVRSQVVARIMSFSISQQQSRLNQLTDRELEVYGLIQSGLKDDEISKRLYLSLEEISKYRCTIQKKMMPEDEDDDR